MGRKMVREKKESDVDSDSERMAVVLENGCENEKQKWK